MAAEGGPEEGAGRRAPPPRRHRAGWETWRRPVRLPGVGPTRRRARPRLGQAGPAAGEGMSPASEGPAAPPPPPAQDSGAPAAPRMARRPEVLCGAAVVLGCACLLALRASCSRAKDVTRPAKLPVSFFPSTSPVHDLFLGQLDQAEDIRHSSEISLLFFYAPWCGQSAAVREEIEQVAKSLADQVLFIAINCWWNQGKCRKQKHFFYFPVIYLYHQSFGPIEYKGPMNAVYIEKFVRRVMTPLLYISSQSRLQRFLSSYEPGVLGYFEFNASPQPPGYLTFFASALHSLNKDYLGTIHFGVITDRLLAKEIALTDSGTIYLHRHVNASLLYPYEALNFTAENVWKWALENRETFLHWLRPHGGKSLLLYNELKKGPALFLFLPFNPLAESHPLLDEISQLALEYKSCKLQGGGPSVAAGLHLPTAESASSPPCCNTVLLPAQWHGLSQTHNVCELCVNQTGGVQPSPLLRLHCSFMAIKAAVDSFYLKERTFFHVVSKTVSWCSDFLSFYSPFSSYTACCRTVNRDLLDLVRAEGASFHLLEVSFAPHGQSQKEDASEPLIEEQAGLSGSAVAGLSCRTNKTLNLYLLDSNLFWMYAERLGAAGSSPAKEFAAIVDLKAEVHYVLGQKRALLRASLETFIRNYTVLYSPLKRHLVGDPRPSQAHLQQHLVQEITTSTFHELILRSPKAILLLYYAPWCGFCASLSHIFIQLARILPPPRFMVARIDVSQNDLPWEFMTDHLPNILFFPHDRKDQTSKFPTTSPISVPNLLKFILRHSSPTFLAAGWGPGLWQETDLQQARIAHLEKEIELLKAEIQALHQAQGQLQGQLSETRSESQRLQRETHALKQQQSHREQLQGLCSQRTWQLEDLAEKLRKLAEASETLLTENAFLKVLLTIAEKHRAAELGPEHSFPPEDTAHLPPPGQDHFSQVEKEGAGPLDSRVPAEHSKENWTE
ncbi:thioredoxin domain-containing protein 11 [Crotalus tigris]|uniref:thioredoxin domain-containing protein 11 n=1 Tax=Crotalus tigris TaxID=88082 RepID=UPI00192F8C8E|nr:thioredoxin domain-containing protein 11 [Crotalus tigris]